MIEQKQPLPTDTQIGLVSIDHLNAARGELVQVRSNSLQIRALVTDVVVPHVVHHDEKYVRLGGGLVAVSFSLVAVAVPAFPGVNSLLFLLLYFVPRSLYPLRSSCWNID